MTTILAADIGGTNSRFAHFIIDRTLTLKLISIKWLPTTNAESFLQLLTALNNSDFTLSASKADIMVIAIAGAVEDDRRCVPPYISWNIDLAELTSGIAKQSFLINDFVAQAYGCISPSAKTARLIIAGEKSQTKGTIGVIGGGTALGMATLVTRSNDDFFVLPSEGGHACFPFVSSPEQRFQRFYQKQSDQTEITGNMVISGNGLQHIHWFLTNRKLKPPEVTKCFTPDSETLALIAKFYGRVCRDYALTALTMGGLYITGGIVAKNPEICTHKNFKTEFLNSTAMPHILNKIPVFVIENQNNGLWGAAFYGQQILRGLSLSYCKTPR